MSPQHTIGDAAPTPPREQRPAGAPVVTFRAAALSDPGRMRDNNEDRFHCDPDRGIFMVVDGVGGQAAGERAAETAIALLRTRLERQTGTVEDRIREAIAVANNEIVRQAALKPEWRGMACVLTVAVAENGHLTIGHVGDTRLYKFRPGVVAKITHDHSPVGEREDAGELTEIEAMRHPRRNEVYRDVGSEDRTPDQPDFIEIQHIPFEADAALLICSDGLSDLVQSSQMLEVVEQYAGSPEQVVRHLIEAANEEGGKDNVTAVYAECERFADAARARARVEGTADLSRRRTAPTAPAPAPVARAQGVEPTTTMSIGGRTGLVLLGLLLGIAGTVLFNQFVGPRLWAARDNPLAPDNAGQTLVVRQDGSTRFPTIASALDEARPGDTIVVTPGEYRGTVHLKTGVAVIAEQPGSAVLKAGTVATGANVVVSANGVERARIGGFRIVGDAAQPVAVGILLNASQIEVEDVEITGALVSGVEISGQGSPQLRANNVHDNPGVGVLVRAGAAPWITHNQIVRNGRAPRAPKPGIELESGARQVLTWNVIADNGAEGVTGVAAAARPDILRFNIFNADGRPNGRGALRVLPR